MCRDCWKFYGNPKIINDVTKTLAEQIDYVYSFHGAGGHLHIVIDDWNLDDESLKFCLKQIEENHFNYSKEQLDAERACAILFLDISLDERVAAMAIQRRFFDV